MDQQKNKEKNNETFNELRACAMSVTEALYRTTDLFSDAEPLKWSLRDSAVKILNIVSDINSQPTYQELRNTQELERMIDSLCYKLHLAMGGTFIARSNFDVLEREYKLLSDQINHTDFLSLPLFEESIKKSYQPIFDSNISDKLDNRTLVVQKSPIELKMSNTKQINNYNYENSTHIVQTKSNVPKKQGLSDRKGVILKLIKEHGPSGVGDLTRLVDMSLSEKTIQRDLNALAEAGILKREGEKRWRKYFL